MSKIIRIFLKKNLLKNIILGAHFSLLTFFENFNFRSTLFSKTEPNFCRLRSSSKQFVSKKNCYEFTHLHIHSMCQQIIVIPHNLGHSSNPVHSGFSNLNDVNVFYLFFQTIQTITDLRDPVYMTSCCKAVNSEVILQLMAKVAWDIREVKSQHSQYVDILLRVSK